VPLPSKEPRKRASLKSGSFCAHGLCSVRRRLSHETGDRLFQLGIAFIGNGHHVGEQQTEIHAAQVDSTCMEAMSGNVGHRSNID
jgi:hypothetical protein